MKIAIIGATGRIGNLLLKEACSRNHKVTAIIRDTKKLKTNPDKVIEKNIMDLEYKDISDQDIIIDAFGIWDSNLMNLHQSTLNHLSDILSNRASRLLVVGEAGSLYIDLEHTIKYMDTEEYPKEFSSLANNMGKAFDELKTRYDVNWTYLCPSANFIVDGERLGTYRAGHDTLLTNNKGRSSISYADYAIAMIDEAEIGKHIRERFTVVSI